MAKRSPGISGVGVLFGTLGVYLVYAGIRDVEFVGGLRDLMQGRKPTERGGGEYDPVEIARVGASLAQGAVGAVTSGECGSTSPRDIVNASGIRVHRSIAQNVNAMVMAARGAGIRLSGDGYRDPQQQWRLRQQNCPDPVNSPASACSPPTAKVGESMHQCGLAIDFDNARTRDTAVFRWLAANAGRYGFRNLPSEPWHWSTNGR